MFKFQILKYYSRNDVQENLVSLAKNREVVGSKEDGSYFKRPGVLVYPRDVIEKVKQGAVAFHCSVEQWSQPMQLSSEMKQQDLEDLRIGWDFVLDIDSKTNFQHAKIAANVVCSFLNDYGIKAGLKFSGRRGFHISIANSAFPKNIDYKDVSRRYPEISQSLATYIRERIKDRLLDALVASEGGVAALMKCLKERPPQLSPFYFIEFEKDWGNRHLIRMPYSLNEKSWLVSVPLSQHDLEKFEPSDAKPDKVKFDRDFLKNKEGEATELTLEALDWISKQKTPKPEVKRTKISIKKTIPEDLFPPCMKAILAGLEDGKKRSIFTLATFLKAMNWPAEDIEAKMKDWNTKNSFPLRENIIRTQVKWHLRQSRNMLPANCDSELFYKSIGVCKPDSNCRNVKNPVNYSFKLFKRKNR